MKKYILLLLMAGSLGGCFSETGKENYIVPLPGEKDCTMGKLSDYIENIRFIPLETGKDSYVGEPLKIIHSGNFFYIATLLDLCIYDNNGKFINRIRRIGRAYGEYLEIADFDIYNKKVYILGINKIIIFSETGNLIDEINTDFTLSGLKVLNEHTFIGTVIDMEKKIFVFNDRNKILNTALDNKLSLRVSKRFPFKTLDNKIIYQLGNSNNILTYDIEKNKFDFLFFLSGGIITNDKEEEYIKRYGYNYFTRIKADRLVKMTSTDEFLLFSVTPDTYFNRKNYIMKKHGRNIIYCIDSKVTDDITLTGDLLAAAEVCYGESSFISYIEPAQLLRNIHKDTLMYNRYHESEFIKQVKPDDNIILIEFNFKSHEK